jgi:hypothetical protein
MACGRPGRAFPESGIAELRLAKSMGVILLERTDG